VPDSRQATAQPTTPPPITTTSRTGAVYRTRDGDGR
jgi:hypothetical protein